ncbi:MAG: dihydroorotase family protein, partial [Crenarchaeota archaeon]|nr:dihydroorotase family protein [Thermoproteota archaeon]
TCEVTPHNLLLTKTDYEKIGIKAITIPPLRSKENSDALWDGINRNLVDCIGSDHAPHSIEDKESKNIWEVKAGIIGLETTLPLILTAVHRNQLTLQRAVELLSEKPAEIFSLHDRGKIEPGKNADLIVIDLNSKYKIDSTKFQSKVKYSPFHGWEVKGKLITTMVGGQIVFDEGTTAEKAGNIIVARGEQ